MKPVKHLFITLVVSGILWMGMMAATDGTMPSSAESLDFSRLAGVARPTLDSELQRFSLGRAAFSDRIIAQIKNPASREAQLAAVYFAGYYRMESAVPALATIIDLHDDERAGPIKGLPMWSEWPVVDALIKVGSPSIPVMIDNISQRDAAVARRLSVVVIRGVLGPRLAKEALREAINDQTGPNALQNVARLNAAIASLDSPSDSHQ